MSLRGAAALGLLLAAGPAPAGQVRAAPAAAPVIALEGTATQGGLMTGTAPPGTAALTLDGTPVPFAPDRRFVIAFDRDAGPQSLLSARLADGRTVARPITVAPRAWRIERLPTLPRASVPTEAFLKLRAPELAAIAAARAQTNDVGGWRQRFVWPVTGRISGLFGAQRIYRGEPGAFHSGVDVARPAGTPVAAPADGVVVLAAAAPFTLEGRLLILDHGMGLNSAFLHLSRIDVRVGDRVRQGQIVGAIGMTGRATGPHLHWSMKWQAARIDPLLVAGAMGGGDRTP